MSSNGKGDTLATETEHQLLELRLALETVKQSEIAIKVPQRFLRNC